MPEEAVLSLPCRYYRQHPVGHPRGHEDIAVETPRGNVALLLVDVYGTVSGGGGDDGPQDLYAARAREQRRVVVDAIAPAKAAAARAGIRCVYVANRLSAGLTAQHAWREQVRRVHGFDVAEVWAPPAPALEFAAEIAPTQADIVIAKQFYSGFFETSLDSCLRSLGVTTLVAAGFDTRVCLLATLMDAVSRSYQVVVLRDGVATHEYAETADGRWSELVGLRAIETSIGSTTTSAAFVEACQALSAEPRETS